MNVEILLKYFNMSHSLTRLWIHGIWTTKNRMPLILPTVEKEVHDELYSELKGIDCPARIINGMEEHVHSLFLLSPNISISNVFKQIKGGSSHTINDLEIIPFRFCWQTGYAAYSVSEQEVEKVYQYILNQKEIHRNRTFAQELEEMNKYHGIPHP